MRAARTQSISRRPIGSRRRWVRDRGGTTGLSHARLLQDGWSVNCKRTQRLWREEGLRVPQRRRKRQRLGESTVPASRLRAERPDQVWALDFQYDQTADGRIIKILHVVDEFTREALAIECERPSLPEATVVGQFEIGVAVAFCAWPIRTLKRSTCISARSTVRCRPSSKSGLPTMISKKWPSPSLG
jgi:transposase InsO family protein